MAQLTLRSLSLVLLAAWTAVAGAETVYKSIDAQGNVTYSSTPPETAGKRQQVEEVLITPGPSEEERLNAEKRAKETEAAAAQSGQTQARQQAARSQIVGEAEKNLAQARANLEQAKVKDLGDWQYLASGGRVLKQSYFDRIAKAERQLREAERALEQARSGP
jgi:hypothetical protein